MEPPAERWNGRPCWAEIDLDAIAHNVGALARLAAPAQLCAVVKANAYGHGAVAVGAAALEAGASSLGVVCVDEGEELRRGGIDAPVLIVQVADHRTQLGGPVGRVPAQDGARHGFVEPRRRRGQQRLFVVPSNRRVAAKTPRSGRG